jgi:hypothetical protein
LVSDDPQHITAAAYWLWSGLFITLMGYGGLGVKFYNGDQTFTINREKVTDHFCYERLGKFTIEKKCKAL